MTLPGDSNMLSPGRRDAAAERNAQRLRDVGRLGHVRRRVRAELDAAEAVLAARLYYCHEEGGLEIDGLAAAAGLERDEAFALIDQHRRAGA